MEIQLWREMLEPYEQAVNEIIVKIDHLIREYQERGMYSPMEQVSGRVKSIPSLLEKAQKKKIPIEEIEDKIEDLAGVRIICRFVEDIDAVVQLLKARTDMRVKKEKDYINNQKQSGYRSYHLIVYYTVETLDGPKELLVEFQIRTLAMNFWAVIEHSLQYKYKRNMPVEIRAQLMEAANSIVHLDEQMSSVRSEIIEAQNSFRIKSNIVAEILNNIQNLYKVANKREVIKIQDEFYKVYESNDLEQLKMFSKQLDIITEGYHAQELSLSSTEYIYKNSSL